MMNKRVVLCCVRVGAALAANPDSRVSLASNSGPPNEAANPAGETELREASAKAIKLIQHSQVIWYQRETCTSCHHQLLPEIPLKLARERGVAVDEKIARATTTNAFASLNDLDSVVQGYDFID